MSVGKRGYLSILQTLLVFFEWHGENKVNNIAIPVLWRYREQEYIPVGCILPTHLPYLGGVCPGGGWWDVCLGVSAQGVPCDLSYHAFDVPCMLFCHQQRLITSAAA